MTYPDDKVKAIELKFEDYENYLDIFNEFKRYFCDEWDCRDLARESIRYSIAGSISHSDETVNKLIDEFNKIGCTSFQMTSEELKRGIKCQEMQKI